jgi:acyl-CoA reductase-like NAD-dependent aldehyde dehydrogenase
MSIETTMAGLGHLINGQVVRGDRTFPVESPCTGQEIAQCPDATVEELDQAMAAAAGAQGDWYALGEEKRREVIRAMAAALTDNLDQVLEISGLEKGANGAALEAYAAPMFASQIAEVTVPVDILEDTDDRTVRVVRKPVGVVVAISPWNAPILITTEKVASALLLGNTVVVKPSPFTPLATLLLGQIWKDIVPPGVVNILAGGDELGVAMVSHPATRMVSFTGSVAAGQRIAAAAGANLTHLVLELGGNDAAIVLPDVDVATVAPKIFGAAFLMGGQVCAAIKRLYVHESIYDEMVSALSTLADQAVAAPADEGGTLIPMTTRPQYDRVRSILEDALAHGAKAAAGGLPTRAEGYFFPATILTNVDNGMQVVDQEQFGPLLPVIPFSDVDVAVAEANATDYGLCGSVWTADIETGEALAARLECGTTWVNNHAEVSPHIPFGGTKHSGIGRNGGTPGLDAYADLQTQYVYKSKDRVLPG